MLEERDDKTLLAVQSVYMSEADRAAMTTGSTMEAGARETYQRLEELLKGA